MPDRDLKFSPEAHPSIRHDWLYVKPIPSPLCIVMDQTGHDLSWASGTPGVFGPRYDKLVRAAVGIEEHLVLSQRVHLE